MEQRLGRSGGVLRRRSVPLFCGFYDGDKMLGRSKGGGPSTYLWYFMGNAEEDKAWCCWTKQIGSGWSGWCGSSISSSISSMQVVLYIGGAVPYSRHEVVV